MTRSETFGAANLVRTIALCGVALLSGTLSAPNARAYPSYDDGNGVGCVECHNGFQGGSGPLHTGHRNAYDISTCNLCHPSGGGSTPVLTYSSGVGGGFGCSGCHGQDYGETSVISDQPKASGYGLREAHALAGVTECLGCHEPVATFLPESVPPPYYGQSTNNLNDPCSSAQEDRDNDGRGLDNDGDGAYDYPADSDCAAPGSTTTTTTLPPADCAPAPVNGCLAPEKASLLVDEKTAGKEKLKVAFKKVIPAVTQSQFGNPVSGNTSYAVCIYNASNQLSGEFLVDRAGDSCSGDACWESVSSKGYKYGDKISYADGIQKMILTGGDPGKGKVVVNGKNNSSTLPLGVASALQTGSHATVQFLSNDAVCFGLTLTDVKTADGSVFKAVGP